MVKVDRTYLQNREHEILTPYIAKSDLIKGRKYKEFLSDYIAGMMDRFALEEHQKLTEPMIKV